MSTPDLAYTRPEISAVMPPEIQNAALMIFGSAALLLLLYTVGMSIRRRTALPFLFAIGALFSALLEPIADVMGNVIHSPVGQISAFQAEGHPVPWHIALAYIWYFGGIPIFLYDRFVHRTMTPAMWWKLAGAAFFGAAAIEQIPVYYGLWHYYGVHPFKIGLMPLSMIWANTVAVIIPALVLYRLMPALVGWRQLLVLAVLPACVVGAHAGTGAPAYVTLGQNTEQVSYWILQAGTIASVVFGGALLWLTIGIVHGRIPDEMPVSQAKGRANAHRSASAASGKVAGHAIR